MAREMTVRTGHVGTRIPIPVCIGREFRHMFEVQLASGNLAADRTRTDSISRIDSVSFDESQMLFNCLEYPLLQSPLLTHCTVGILPSKRTILAKEAIRTNHQHGTSQMISNLASQLCLADHRAIIACTAQKLFLHRVPEPKVSSMFPWDGANNTQLMRPVHDLQRLPPVPDLQLRTLGPLTELLQVQAGCSSYGMHARMHVRMYVCTYVCMYVCT